MLMGRQRRFALNGEQSQLEKKHCGNFGISVKPRIPTAVVLISGAE
jgi:hypothetical protein